MNSIPQNVDNLNIDRLVKEFRGLCKERWNQLESDLWTTEDVTVASCGSSTNLLQNVLSAAHELRVARNFCNKWQCPNCSTYKAAKVFEYYLRKFLDIYKNGQILYYGEVTYENEHELKRIRDNITHRAHRASLRTDYLTIRHRDTLEIITNSPLPGYGIPRELTPIEEFEELIETLKRAFAVPYEIPPQAHPFTPLAPLAPLAPVVPAPASH